MEESQGRSLALAVKVSDREGPRLILTFKGAKTVLGVQALEALGLRMDPTTSKLGEHKAEGHSLLLSATEVK